MGRVIDETGNRYGRWVVARRVKNKGKSGATWLCRCDCGNEKVVRGIVLRKGASRSCGCLSRDLAGKRNLVDMTGKKFGRLTVIERVSSDMRGQATWLCECECGNKVVKVGGKLRYGRVKSCGCLQRDARLLPPGEAAFNTLFSRLKSRALKQGYEWNLTKGELYTLTQQPCSYCGVEPQQNVQRASSNGEYRYNGLDRVDNNKGYIIENVTTCCKTCNFAKQSMTAFGFWNWICRVYSHLSKQMEENRDFA